jgi:hypothetical protein
MSPIGTLFATNHQRNPRLTPKGQCLRVEKMRGRTLVDLAVEFGQHEIQIAPNEQ